MLLENKIAFLKDSIEPLSDAEFGSIYRAAVYLTDGTYLPCVRFLNPQPLTRHAIKRFDQERKKHKFFNRDSGQNYESIVELLVCRGNRLSEYDIDSIEVSPFAFPINIMKRIKGETTMSWTGFCGKMRDGKIFGFGSRFRFDFFQMPPGYTGGDIVEIINHSYLSISGQVEKHTVPFLNWPENYDPKSVHRERPFFDCYVEGL